MGNVTAVVAPIKIGGTQYVAVLSVHCSSVYKTYDGHPLKSLESTPENAKQNQKLYIIVSVTTRHASSKDITSEFCVMPYA
ncbi:hypothetical protein TNCT_714931 [Trichonephila clavata]|uniref:Uncharacterized protein n=1 Tax=Trichonephila clavata TaxID=2740835 RepID=A0A8X6J092_TRICU|nr:hypothetical protein TNCT_714931 [Trichonephila clavata]